MMRHIVLVRGDVDLADVISELAAFCEKFEGVLAFHAGANASIEPDVMHGFAQGFVIDFEDAKARDRYVHDPGHQAIGAKLVAACDNGINDVVVFDLEYPQ